MFGSTELNEESIKYFAKRDLYLADSLAGLEEQIYTCIRCLEMLTRRGGIASEGYVYGFDMLSKHKREFLALLRMDSLFPVKSPTYWTEHSRTSFKTWEASTQGPT